nr:uncharacterized protein LOC105487126 [Macaca nemestrina]XP_045229667.1 uncharacterized protein LOC123569177 [Macaca fascicularis]
MTSKEGAIFPCNFCYPCLGIQSPCKKYHCPETTHHAVQKPEQVKSPYTRTNRAWNSERVMLEPGPTAKILWHCAVKETEVHCSEMNLYASSEDLVGLCTSCLQ